MKKIKSSKPFSINVFDVAMAIVFLCLLLCTYVKINDREFSMITEKYRDAEIVICTDNNDDGLFANSIKNGDKLYFEENDELFGEVTSVENIHEYEYVKNTDTKLLEKKYTNVVTGKRITVSAKVKENADGCFVNGSEYVSSGYPISVINASDKSGGCAVVWYIAYPNQK